MKLKEISHALHRAGLARLPRSVALCWCVATPALAADPQEAAPEAPIQQVQIKGEVVNQRQTDTATRVVVGREELLRYGDSSLQDALKRQVGVSVTGGELRMRGLGAGYTQILVNGDPAPPGFSIESLSPEMVERVEILRSASAEYSTQAIAGTINVVLRKTVRRSQQDFKLGAQRNQGRWTPTASAQLADRSDDFSYSLSANLNQLKYDVRPLVRETEGRTGFAPSTERLLAERDVADVRTANLAPRLNWKLANGDTVNWQSLIEQYRISSNGTQDQTLLRGESTTYPHNRWTSESRTTALRSDVTWSHELAQGKISAKLGLNRNKRETDFVFLGSDAARRLTMDRDVHSEATDDNYLTSGKYVSSLFAGHNLAVGWDGTWTRRSEMRLQHDRPADSPPPPDIDEDYTADVRRLALYVQDEWDVTPRAQVYLGVRWEGLNTDTRGRQLASVHNRSSVFSPVGQLLWKLPGSEKDQVRVALARTYKAPLTRNLVPRRYTMNNDNGPTNPDTQGNPDLRPELAWGLDLAYESYFGKEGMFSVAPFVRRISNVTLQRLYEQQGIWISTPVNEGRARVYGVALEVKAPLRTWLPEGPAIDLRANAAWNRSRLDAVPGPDNRLGDQTPLTANLGLDYKVGEALTVGGNYSVQTGGPAQVTRTLRTYAGVQRLFDAYGLWKLDKKRQLRLTFTNILHQDLLANRLYLDASEYNARDTTTPTRTGIRFVYEQTL
ncbi:TonB-dependent receptor [[Empedobacter] haloabium]|uniref:TonB-dependent receptor n=1 Tax=[Empedobacter] haloabium TaxID=592317 RepID=A0ABZ1UJI0_9BURK